MKHFVSGLLAVAVAVLFATSLPAEEKKEKKKVGKAKDPYANVFSFKKIALDDKQKDHLESLKKEYGPKLAELDKKINTILTPERRKTAREASKKALGDGKSKKDASKAGHEAMNLSKDEQKELGGLNKERGKLMKEINQKKTALLTDEQKEALKPKKKPKKDS